MSVFVHFEGSKKEVPYSASQTVGNFLLAVEQVFSKELEFACANKWKLKWNKDFLDPDQILSEVLTKMETDSSDTNNKLRLLVTSTDLNKLRAQQRKQRDGYWKEQEKEASEKALYEREYQDRRKAEEERLAAEKRLIEEKKNWLELQKIKRTNRRQELMKQIQIEQDETDEEMFERKKKIKVESNELTKLKIHPPVLTKVLESWAREREIVEHTADTATTRLHVAKLHIQYRPKDPPDFNIIPGLTRICNLFSNNLYISDFKLDLWPGMVEYDYHENFKATFILFPLVDRDYLSQNKKEIGPENLTLDLKAHSPSDESLKLENATRSEECKNFQFVTGSRRNPKVLLSMETPITDGGRSLMEFQKKLGFEYTDFTLFWKIAVQALAKPCQALTVDSLWFILEQRLLALPTPKQHIKTALLLSLHSRAGVDSELYKLRSNSEIFEKKLFNIVFEFLFFVD